MKRTATKLIFTLLCLTMGWVYAQDNKVEVYEKTHIPKKDPVPYPYVREADVMWSKVIWRMIDLREKMNLPYYYPSQPIGNRMNLISLIFYGIDNEGLQVYDAQDDLNEFKVVLTKEQVDAAFDAGWDTIVVDGVQKVIKQDRKMDEVRRVLIKEKWYFDKNYSTMQVRILGICPIRVYSRLDDQGNPTEEVLQKKTFWVYYPEFRDLFSRFEVYNSRNDAQTISYDDLLWQRRFAGYIYQESNVYNNRPIISYMKGVDILYESERIKEFLFNTEHDLWEY